MVHALGEIRRVLLRDGILIDLRPLLEYAPLEVVSASETRLAGTADQLPDDRAGDEAANRAVAQVEGQDWFIKEREDFFPFNYYWDSPTEMQQYLEAEWSNSVTVDEEVWRNVRSMWAVANADALVRIQLKMLITRWRKKA
ncbi:MAG: hypothetical protein AB1554_00125 [Chloroflexota bacterium]